MRRSSPLELSPLSLAALTADLLCGGLLKATARHDRRAVTEQTRQTHRRRLEEGTMFSRLNFPQTTPHRFADVARAANVSAAEA
jgi:hypothetical protein